jgi:hypothetical protein
LGTCSWDVPLRLYVFVSARPVKVNTELSKPEPARLFNTTCRQEVTSAGGVQRALFDVLYTSMRRERVDCGSKVDYQPRWLIKFRFPKTSVEEIAFSKPRRTDGLGQVWVTVAVPCPDWSVP